MSGSLSENAKAVLETPLNMMFDVFVLFSTAAGEMISELEIHPGRACSNQREAVYVWKACQ